MQDVLPALEELRKIVDRKATESRDVRDGLNQKMRGHIDTRNSFNSQVRELIAEVQRQKVIRDDANGSVRDAKSERSEKNQEVRDADGLPDSNFYSHHLGDGDVGRIAQ